MALLSLDALRDGATKHRPKRNQGIVNVVQNPNAIDSVAEREAAEWVLSVGGVVGLHGPDDMPILLVDGKLPEGRFTLNSAAISGDVHFAAGGLSHLRSCRRLVSIDVYGCSRLTDAGIAALEGGRMRFLALIGCRALTDNAMRSIALIRGLEGVQLASPGFTDAGIAALKPLKELRGVNTGDSGITDEGLARLAEVCPQITSLAIAGQDGKRSVRAFSRFANLTDAGICGDQLSDDAVTVLNAHPTIQRLSLGGPSNDAAQSIGSASCDELSTSGYNRSTAKVSPRFLPKPTVAPRGPKVSKACISEALMSHRMIAIWLSSRNCRN